MFHSLLQKTGSAVITVLLFFLPPSLFAFDTSTHILQPYDFNIVIKNRYDEGVGLSGEYLFYSGINGRWMLFADIPVSYNNEKGVHDPVLGARLFVHRWGNTSVSTEWRLLIPFGKSMYRQDSGYVQQRGVNQLSTGIHIRQEFSVLNVFLSGFHNFLEEDDGDLYGSFWLDPGERRTYTGVLGLNPWQKGAFLSGEQLQNDWYELLVKINSREMYPLIPACSFYYASSYVSSVHEDINIEGAGASPLIADLSLSYYISSGSFFMGTFRKSFHVNEEYPSYSMIFSMSALF